MANKLKFELGGTGKSWKYQEISFPARGLHSLNLVDFYACCFFYATNATYDHKRTGTIRLGGAAPCLPEKITQCPIA